MSSFQDLGAFVHNNPEAKAKRSYAHAALNYKTNREPVLHRYYLYARIPNISSSQRTL